MAGTAQLNAPGQWRESLTGVQVRDYGQDDGLRARAQNVQLGVTIPITLIDSTSRQNGGRVRVHRAGYAYRL